MAIKKYNPTSPARRHMSVSAFDEITSTTPEKSLLSPIKENAGRNAHGRITVRHQGGGAKRKYRLIDFRRDKDGVPAKVATISMILIEALTLLCYTMWMEKRDIF